MRLRHWRSVCCSVSIIGLAVVCSGCGRKGGPAPAAKSAQTAAVSLPEWAPRNPSPEFLRAAQVLKPVALDGLLTADDPLALAAQQSSWIDHILPRSWELFGTLSDEQVERFRATGEIVVRVREMTPEQWSAFRRMLDDLKGIRCGGDDLLDLEVTLYKMGAREDFSNVEVRFGSFETRGKGHAVILSTLVLRSAPGDPGGAYGFGPIAQY